MPYNEFGEYIPDDLALDEMKYELAKKGIMPLRPGGSDVPYVASEVPQTYVAKPPPRPASTATNVPQAIADRLGLSAIPQAALGMISSFPAAVAKETGFPKVAEAIQYTPTSKMGQEVLEGVSRLPQVVTGSEMGAGPLAEFYVPRRGFGLQSRPLLSPDDVRVMGGRAIETGRELRNVPEDFRAAQEGLRRESVFGGPTLGARTQGLFDEIGDVMARREMQGLSPIPGIPDVVSPQTRMYAVRPANVGQMIDPTDLPTAKYGDTPRKVRTVQNIIQDIVPYTESDYPHNTSSEYYNAAVRDAPKPLENAWRTFSQKKINEMFPDAPDDSAAAEAYGNRFNQKEFALSQINMLSDFARSPEALSAIESVANERDQLINEYNAQKNKPRKDLKTDEERRAHEENVEQLELQLLQKDLMPELSRDEFIKRITPPNKEEYMRRAQAAKDYLEGTFKKDIAKYIGTSQGPQMELAKRGITMAPKEELFEMMKKFESPRSAFRGELDDLGKERAKAGFNPRGEMYPLIVQKETEVKDLQAQLNDLNRQKSELRDLHRAEMPDEPDPARNPTETGAKYRALTNPMNTLIDKIEQSKKQLENFRLANAYETISDVAYTPVLAKEFKKSIPFSEKQFFPNLEKTPDTAQMFNVKSRELGELGIPFLAEMITKNIMSGRIPLNEKGKPMTSIDKIIEQLTKPRIKEETIKEAESRKGMVQLNEYAQDTLSKIPPELRFKNSSVLELTEKSNEDAIRRQISFDGMVLDHCIAGCDAPHPGINPFSGERYSYSYPVDPATGKDRGDRKLASSFMKNVLQGGQRTAHVRDNTTGLPVITINMLKEGSGKYNLNYVSGYQNKAEPESVANYAEDVKNYLNLRADIIKGSGDALNKWGILDTTNNDGQRKIASLMNINSSSIPSLGLPRFVLENDVRKMALEQPMGDTHADLLRRRNQLNDEYNRIIRDRGEDDPEAIDIADDIQDLTARLQDISRQVVTQPSDRPNVFRRMSSEALTNGLQLEGRLDEVLDLVNRTVHLLNTDGLVDFWADDYEFFPERLRTFTNAVRNDENLSQAMTAQYGEGYTTQDRERLARFQLAIRDYTPHQREVLVRELDRYAEANILQQIDNLNPDDPEDGQRQYEEAHPDVPDYLRQISRRRFGQDFEPETAPSEAGARFDAIARIIRDGDRSVSAELQGLSRRHGIESPEFADALRARINEFTPGDVRRNGLIDALSAWQSVGRPAQTAMPAPRDIANQVVPMNQAFRDQTVQEVAEAINNSIRNLPEDRETLQEALAQYQRNPLDIPGSIEMILPTSSVRGTQNEYRRTISNYLIQQIQNRLGNQAPALIEAPEEQPLIPEWVRGSITREMNELMELGQLEQTASILNRIFGREGYFSNLDDETIGHAADFTNLLLGRLLDDPDYRPANGQRAGAENVSPFVRQTLNNLPGIADEAFVRGEVGEQVISVSRDFSFDDNPAQFIRALRERSLALDQGDPDREMAVDRQREAGRLLGALANVLERTGNGPEAYRDQYTNEEMGSRRAFDQIMQAERITPGAINEAIRRTDGRAMYDDEVMRFYNVQAPAGISQINNALRRYMEGNGFDIEAPAVNPIDELERRYGQERAPIDIVSDGLNNPIPQFERDYPENVQREYREIIAEIDSPVNGTNLQNAMHHLGMVHDIIESGDHEPEHFGLTSRQEMTRLAELIERHFEVFRQFENLLDNADREPPEGRKRGGFIEQATGVRSYSDLKRDKFNRKYYDDGQAALDFQLRHGVRSDQLGVSPKRYPERSEADIIAPKSDEYLNFRHQDDLKRGGRVKKMNKGGKVNPVPSAMNIPSEHPRTPPVKPVVNLTDPGFAEELKYQIEQRQKSSSRPSGGGGLTDVELKNRLGSRNPTYNAGGKVSIDQMRYELLRK